VRVLYDRKPEDALILDGRRIRSPRPSMRRGAPETSPRLRPPGQRDDVRNALNEHPVLPEGGRDLHPPSTKDRTPVVVRPAGRSPAQPDLVDLVQMTINQKLNPQVKPTPRTSSSWWPRRGLRRGETFLPMTLTAKIMYELVKFYAGSRSRLSRRCSSLTARRGPAQIRGGDVEFFRPTRCSRECPTRRIEGQGTLIYLLDGSSPPARGRGGGRPVSTRRPDGRFPRGRPDRLVKRSERRRFARVRPDPPYQERTGSYATRTG